MINLRTRNNKTDNLKLLFSLKEIVIFQGSASEASLIALLAARDKFVRTIHDQNPEIPDSEIKGKLVAYSSDQSNSSVEKAGIIGSMTMRLLPSDEDGIMRGHTLQEAIRQDRENGLIPCFAIASLGTTGTCAFDNLGEIGPVCQEEGVWLHIDAAYAGTAFICPELNHLMQGVEYADSFNFNPHKWMLTNFDCSCMWVKDARNVINAFNVDRIYLKHNKISNLPEYRHWQIPLGRRFRALKLWFVLRSYGVEGIQAHVRKDISLAKYFEHLVRNDERYEVCTSSLGLVTFRLKGEDKLTQQLLDNLTADKSIYVIPCHYRRKLVIRFAITSRNTEKKDIDFAWKIISDQTATILEPKIKNVTGKIEPVISDKYKFDAIKITTATNCLEKSK